VSSPAEADPPHRTGPVRPPLAYYGGKTTLAPAIAALLPAHEHYVEPYAGSLAVLLAKPRARHETVNDLDQDLVTFWKVLRDRPAELARACALTPHARLEHLAAHRLDDHGDGAAGELEQARRVWVMLTQGRAGLRRPPGKATGWRHFQTAAGRTIAMPDRLAAHVERIAPAAARLARVSLECRPALEVITRYGRHTDVLLYVDPPYLGTARTRSGWSGYPHDLRDPAAHRELAAALHACRAAVVLSGYPSDLYDQRLYPDWHRHTIPTTTGQGGQHPGRVEVLWSNRPLATQTSLFDPQPDPAQPHRRRRRATVQTDAGTAGGGGAARLPARGPP
jgi:DNA adenine methylase